MVLTGGCAVEAKASTRVVLRRLAPLGATALLVALVDLLGKAWAQRALADGNVILLAGEFFRLRLGYNTGVAFGFLAGPGAQVFYLTGGIVAAAAAWLWRLASRGPLPGALAPIGPILGGAIGNLLDRLPDGRVTDFLDAGIGAARFPTFNLADTAITLGAGALVVLSRRGLDSHRHAASSDSLAASR